MYRGEYKKEKEKKKTNKKVTVSNFMILNLFDCLFFFDLRSVTFGTSAAALSCLFA
jgi:hypothetical protein